MRCYLIIILLCAVLRVFLGTLETKEAAGKCDGNMGHMVYFRLFINLLQNFIKYRVLI